MIHQAKRQLIELGFSEVKQFEDTFGTVGYGVRFMGDDYVLVAKQYAHKDMASFLEKLVVQMGDDVDFIFYNDDTERYTVFDGVYLKKYSDRSSGPSKKRDCYWREIDLSCGAELNAFIRNEESPRTLAGNNAELGVFM